MERTEVFDALIVGSGPAGLFAAVEFRRGSPSSSLCVIDKGEDLRSRVARAEAGNRRVGWLEGFGGAGFFIGGRLSLDLDSPSGRPSTMEPHTAMQTRNHLVELLQSWEAWGTLLPEPPQSLRDMGQKAAEVGLQLQLNYPALHLNAQERFSALNGIESMLQGPRVEVLTSSHALDIAKADGAWTVRVSMGAHTEVRRGKTLLLAPGRSGAAWLARTCESAGVPSVISESVGVRIEMDQTVLAPLTNLTPDPRFFMTQESGEYRTYAFAVGGRVVVDDTTGISRISVRPGRADYGGHTSFSLLWHPSIPADLHLSRVRRPSLANLSATLSNHPHRRGSILRSPSNEDITRASIRSHWPESYWAGMTDFLKRFEHLVPALGTADGFVYSPAVERQWTYRLDERGQTEIPGLYLAGDGAGVSQGAMGAALSGIAVGQALG